MARRDGGEIWDWFGSGGVVGGFGEQREGRRGEGGRSRSALSRAMMRDMSDDQPWARAVSLSGSSFWQAGRGKSLCGSDADRVRTRERRHRYGAPVSAKSGRLAGWSLDTITKVEGRSVHDDIRDLCLAKLLRKATFLPPYPCLDTRTNYVSKRTAGAPPPATCKL